MSTLPLGGPPYGFAHRGGRGRHRPNTLPAFEAALAAGAPGLESDVRLTEDGVPVLVHSIPLPRRRRIGDLTRAALPAHIPSLGELYARCGSDFELALDMADPGAVEEVVRIAGEHGAADRLWLTYWRMEPMRRWRARWPGVRLVVPSLLPPGGRRREARLRVIAGEGIDAVNVYHLACSGELVDRAHAHGLLVLAWGARGGRAVERALRRGVDGVFADDVAALCEALREARSHRLRI
jgi:glycerophosphoryl diester phosphodiesterase